MHCGRKKGINVDGVAKCRNITSATPKIDWKNRRPLPTDSKKLESTDPILDPHGPTVDAKLTK